MSLKNISSKKAISFRSANKKKEDLPFSIVLYPSFYGAFFAFREKRNSEIFFCSCAKEAIENYIRFRLTYPIPTNINPARMYILDSAVFPYELVTHLIQNNISSNEKVINYLQFENKLCHECNKATPNNRYCHEMYGSVFKQNYGWYINKQAYEYGIQPLTYRTLNNVCPVEILELVKLNPDDTIDLLHQFNALQTNESYLKHKELSKDFNKQCRKIWKIIENEVRQKFGHKKVGEAWTSETILYYIIKKLYPEMTINRHYRPDILEGLELDIYIKDFNLGIEYQGIQHFEPIKHWGGNEGLEKTKSRDKKKKELCDLNNIKLVYFNYDEELSNDYIQLKLKKYVT